MNAERPQTKVFREVCGKALVSGYFMQPTSGLLIHRSKVRIFHGPPPSPSPLRSPFMGGRGVSRTSEFSLSRRPIERPLALPRLGIGSAGTSAKVLPMSPERSKEITGGAVSGKGALGLECGLGAVRRGGVGKRTDSPEVELFTATTAPIPIQGSLSFTPARGHLEAFRIGAARMSMGGVIR